MHTETKRRNAPRTKEKILRAAQTAFSQIGYARAGIREIAAIADVSSTLLLRYYGSKAGLFEAALTDTMRLEPVLEVPREKIGATLAARFLDTDLNIMPPSMIALSAGDEEAREIAGKVVREHVIKPLAHWLGPPDASARAIEMTMLSISFVLFTRQIPLAHPRKSAEKRLARRLAHTLQAIVDGIS